MDTRSLDCAPEYYNLDHRWSRVFVMGFGECIYIYIGFLRNLMVNVYIYIYVYIYMHTYFVVLF